MAYNPVSTKYPSKKYQLFLSKTKVEYMAISETKILIFEYIYGKGVAT